MEKSIKVQEVSQKKEYVAPKLSTHGDVAKLTQHFAWPPKGPGSEIVLR
ncbi:MAG TPA: hypothetical protein VIM11_24840 [Tepidisphaeraceae bacterium]|jgi:hypothetical protein